MRTGRALAGNPGTRACRLGKPTQCVDSLELFDGVNPCAKWLAYLAYLGDSACGLTRKLAQALAPQFVTLGLLFSSGHSVAPGIVIVAILTFGVIVVYRPRNRADAFAPV